jgi:hypothetical protein
MDDNITIESDIKTVVSMLNAILGGKNAEKTEY